MAEEKAQYDKALNALNLGRNKDPFPLDPPKSVDYWADNKEILDRMLKIQFDSSMFASSFIYVLYGPVGGGKTFAIKYLANPEIQKTISGTLKRPTIESFNMRVRAIVPTRSGQLTFSLHKDIVEFIFAKIRANKALLETLVKWNDFGEGSIRKAFKDIVAHVARPLDGKWGIPSLENTEGYKFLTQSTSSFGKLNDVNDLVETIRILVLILSRNYSRVVISVDELENLSRATGTERFLVSDFFRKIYEDIEYDLTLFLIFTLDSFEEVESLLQKAFLSRVTGSIEFSYVKSQVAVEEYITECISKRCNVNPYDVITQDTISTIAESLINTFKGKLAFRTINIEMHRIFTDTYIAAKQPQEYKIDLALYNKANRATVSADLMKKIIEELTKGELK